MFDDAADPVDQQCEERHQHGSGNEHARQVEVDAGGDEDSEPAAVDEGGKRRGPDQEHERRADTGEHDGHRERELDPQQHRQRAHPHSAARFDEALVHLGDAHHGVAEDGQQGIEHQCGDGCEEAEPQPEGQQHHEADGRCGLADIGQRQHGAGERTERLAGEEYPERHGDQQHDSGGHRSERKMLAGVSQDRIGAEGGPFGVGQVRVQQPEEQHEPCHDDPRELEQQRFPGQPGCFGLDRGVPGCRCGGPWDHLGVTHRPAARPCRRRAGRWFPCSLRRAARWSGRSGRSGVPDRSHP